VNETDRMNLTARTVSCSRGDLGTWVRRVEGGFGAMAPPVTYDPCPPDLTDAN